VTQSGDDPALGQEHAGFDLGLGIRRQLLTTAAISNGSA